MSQTNAQIVLNSRDRQNANAKNYNDAQYNAQSSGGGQNIIQGEIREIALSEINFPYDIPNMQTGFNYFELVRAIGGIKLLITVPPGFYTGSELAIAINEIITEVGAAQPVPLLPGDMPTVTYFETANLFTFNAPTTNPGGAAGVWAIVSPYTCPFYIGSDTPSNGLGKDILSIMGYLPEQNGNNYVDADPVQQRTRFDSAGAAPLAFTQYIDVCSDKLTSNQMFQGGSTTNLARRQNVICRLFICDNISNTVPEVEGTRPFILNRQFFNARVMKWSTENSIPTIDIQLYDDIGQPLTTTWQPRNYAITFNAQEITDSDRLVKENMGESTIKSYANYKEQNVSRAWANIR